ncbi:MAG: hypothetical protein J7M40_12035 [Planctomycetes bacterium]|nr:hypothetical protein [Planctomycetota bacterium]
MTDQCWKLTATLLSKYDFDDLSHPCGEYWCSFIQFAQRFDDIFAKELIELAVLARVSLEVDGEFGAKQIVGKLIKNGNESDLNFREACNKIIHANSLEIKLEWSNSHPLDNGQNGYEEGDIVRFKNPIIMTQGTFREVEWKANIHFLKYVSILQEKFS